MGTIREVAEVGERSRDMQSTLKSSNVLLLPEAAFSTISESSIPRVDRPKQGSEQKLFFKERQNTWWW